MIAEIQAVTRTAVFKISNVLAKRAAIKFNLWDYFRVLIDDSSGETHECMCFLEDQRQFKFYCSIGQIGSFTTTHLLKHLKDCHNDAF